MNRACFDYAHSLTRTEQVILQRSGAPENGPLNISADSFRVQIPPQRMNRIISGSGDSRQPAGAQVTASMTFANLTQLSRVAGIQVCH
jgi:hypothetical protein